MGEIAGIGPITASAIVVTVWNAREFKNGRKLAAWMGLVPRQYSSGGKQTLLGISKRGDTYLTSAQLHPSRCKSWTASFEMPWRIRYSRQPKLLDRNSSFGKEYLKLLLNEIRIEGKQAQITGSYAALATAIAETKMGTGLS